jgi:multiple sugar transport system permease protein
VAVPTRSIGTKAQVRRRHLSSGSVEAIWAYVFLLPNFLLILVFTAFPVVAGFGLSFTRWDLLQPARFVGIANYAKLATEPLFQQVLFNSFYFVVGTIPPQTVLALAMALALNQKIRGMTFYRAAYFMPVVTSMVAVAMVWQWLYQPEFGVINSFLKMLGIAGPKWLFSDTWAMPSVIIVGIWKNVGYSMVIFLAALQSVPEELHDAAKIDGAGAWSRFTQVTIAMISPAIFFVIVLSIIGSFIGTFDAIYILTQGGPANATLVIVYYLYQYAFQFYQMGYAAAVAYVLFVILFIATLIQWRLRRRWVYGES